jgi:hypothetical protein
MGGASVSARDLIELCLKYLNSEAFRWKFIFGLEEQLPRGWTPLHDYALIFGDYRHSSFDLIRRDETLPFQDFPFLQPAQANCRLWVLVNEIAISVSTGALPAIQSFLTPSEWFELKRQFLEPFPISRATCLTLLHFVTLFGLDDQSSLSENWDRLIDEAMLGGYDRPRLIAFLNAVYYQCRAAFPALPFQVQPPDGIDTSWISESQIRSLGEVWSILFDIRRLARGLIDQNRLDLCEPWSQEVWNPASDRFFIKITAKIGFSSFFEFFLDRESPLSGRIYNFAALKPEFERLRAQEIGREIALPQELRPFRLLFRVEDRISRARHLASILSVAPFGVVLVPPQATVNAIIVMNTGDYKKVGYFAYRTLSDGKEGLALVGCIIGGTMRSPNYRLSVYGRKEIVGNHFKPEEAFRMFKEKAKELWPGLEVPGDLSWHAFFGLSEKAVRGPFWQ